MVFIVFLLDSSELARHLLVPYVCFVCWCPCEFCHELLRELSNTLPLSCWCEEKSRLWNTHFVTLRKHLVDPKRSAKWRSMLGRGASAICSTFKGPSPCFNLNIVHCIPPVAQLCTYSQKQPYLPRDCGKSCVVYVIPYFLGFILVHVWNNIFHFNML